MLAYLYASWVCELPNRKERSFRYTWKLIQNPSFSKGEVWLTEFAAPLENYFLFFLHPDLVETLKF